MEHATTDSLRLMQSDSYKKLAEWALPSRLQALDSAALDASGKEVRQMLADWNYQNSAELIAPSVFEVWWDFLKQAIWDDEFPEHETRPMRHPADDRTRSEEHTSELQSLMRISYAVFCLKKKKTQPRRTHQRQ